MDKQRHITCSDKSEELLLSRERNTIQLGSTVEINKGQSSGCAPFGQLNLIWKIFGRPVFQHLRTKVLK